MGKRKAKRNVYRSDKENKRIESGSTGGSTEAAAEGQQFSLEHPPEEISGATEIQDVSKARARFDEENTVPEESNHSLEQDLRPADELSSAEERRKGCGESELIPESLIQALFLREVSYRYGRRHVLTSISAEVFCGQITGLLGKSGSGKTTLLKLLAGRLRSKTGTALIAGYPVGKKTKTIVSYLPEEELVDPAMTVRKINLQWSRMYRNQFDSTGFHQFCTSCEIEEDRLIAELSRSQRRAVSVAAALFRESSIYLLDEPLADLGGAARRGVLRRFIELAMNNSAILLATNDLYHVEELLDRVIVLQKGTVRYFEDAEILKQRMGRSLMAICEEETVL